MLRLLQLDVVFRFTVFAEAPHAVQKYNLPLSKLTAQQLMLASTALRGASSQCIASLKVTLLTDGALQLLGWRTVFQALLLAGDDGTAVLDICENMTTEELVNERECSKSAAVAAVHAIMRATDVTLSDRLLKARRLLSRLSLAQVCTACSYLLAVLQFSAEMPPDEDHGIV